MRPDDYQSLCADVLKGFADGLSVVEGSCPKGDAAAESHWRGLVDRLARERTEVLATACWADLTDPGAPLLRWRCVKKEAQKDQGTRVLFAEGQAWVIDGFGKLVEKLALDDAVHAKLKEHGLKLPVLEEKKKP